MNYGINKMDRYVSPFPSSIWKFNFFRSNCLIEWKRPVDAVAYDNR